MPYRKMTETDIENVIPFYIEHYNKNGGSWTYSAARKRIHQVWSIEDSYCLIFEENKEIIGFAMGYFEQYDDLTAYNLSEIVVSPSHQGKGKGTELMAELEQRVKKCGASLIQLQAIKSDLHERFYEKLKYKNAGSLIIKTKWLGG